MAFTIDATEQNFQDAVVEESKRRPVVVDFWATWCAPCRALGPVLERLAEQGKGQWLLAKLDTDRAQQLARRYAIRSIPAVKAFRNGEVVNEFTGALPEREVRKFLERILPSPAAGEVEQARASLQAGKAEEAEAHAKAAVEADPKNGEAHLLLAELAVARAEHGAGGQAALEAAAGHLERAKLDPAVAQRAVALEARLGLMAAASNGGGEDAALARAASEALAGRPDAAFEQALSVLRSQRATHGERARQLALQAIALMDPDAARERRRELSMALH